MKRGVFARLDDVAVGRELARGEGFHRQDDTLTVHSILTCAGRDAARLSGPARGFPRPLVRSHAG
jgi:hypothetical protein